jgi:two-component system, NtrC family, response regulator AtoC
VPDTATASARMLVVSREPSALDSLWAVAETNSWHLETADSGWKALERVQSATSPDLLLLDLERGDRDGLHTLRWLHRVRPDLPIVILSHADDAERKMEAIRLGAQDFLIKPLQLQELEAAVQRDLSADRSRGTEMPVEYIEPVGGEVFFVAASSAMRKLRAQAELLARIDDPVLIVGEPGSGKRVVARLIHKLSVRSEFRFLPLDCATLPGDVLETELFGNARGATEQTRTQAGQLELRTKGTILLEDITELPASVQAKLLYVLREQPTFRSNNEGASSVDIRILAATSANLDQALAEKKFREDLYYRLSAFTIHVLPLRQRKEEIALLLAHFMQQLARHYGLPPRTFSPAMREACERYSWPGNLRELEGFAKRYLATGNEAMAIDEMRSGASRTSQGGNHGGIQEAEVPPRSEPEERSSGLKSLVQSVKGEAERNAIAAALDETRWNRKAAARLLKVSYRTLLYKIELYRMSPPPYPLPLLAGHTVRGGGHGSQ